MKTTLNPPSATSRCYRCLAHHLLAGTIFLGTLLGGLTPAWPKPGRCAESSTSHYPQAKISKAKRDFLNDLSTSRSGRVLLHTVCLIRHPEKARWHWHGILRELTR